MGFVPISGIAMNKTVISITRISLAAARCDRGGGCEAEKSRNPLSPNVAGPIAGVSISVADSGQSRSTAPKSSTPQPVRLVFNNASTNGERPFFYVVELAVRRRASRTRCSPQSQVTPVRTQTSSIVVDGTLTAERTYYWRAKADDGANESEYSSAAKFDIVVPIVIEAPVPVSPVAARPPRRRAGADCE